MKIYECIGECFAEDFHFYRVGDERRVEDSYNHNTLDVKFKLIRADKPEKAEDPEADIIAGIKEIAKEKGLKKADLNKIYIAAKAIDNADRLKALVDYEE